MPLSAEVQAEEAFINEFDARPDGTPTAPATDPKVAAPVAPAKPAAIAPKDTPASETAPLDGEATDLEPTDEELAKAAGENVDPELAPAEDEPTEIEEVEDEPVSPDARLSDDTRAALAKHGWDPKELADLPPEARSLVEIKLANIDSSFTRAQQEARSYRADEAKYREAEARFRAEQRYATEHPELVIAEMLKKDPSLAEKVGTITDEFGKPMIDAAFDVNVREQRRLALEAELKVEQDKEAVRSANEKILTRSAEMRSYVAVAMDRLGIPLDPDPAVADIDPIWEAVSAAIWAKGAPEARAQGLTPQELDAVILRQRTRLESFASRLKTTKARDVIRARTKDRQVASPAARAGASRGPARPTGAPTPKNDDEFAEQFAGV